MATENPEMKIQRKAPTARLSWRIALDRELSLDQPRLMGVLNVTPDSFSDGGRYTTTVAAVDHALSMINDGADIIDIGGESTRPGAARIDSSQQQARVLPIIKTLRQHSDVILSIDTTRAEVAEAALDAGANIINDVAAGSEDDDMFDLAARTGCGIILMHRLHPPGCDQYSDQYDTPPQYENVTDDVRTELLHAADAAITAGIDRTAIVLDPGLGFGKTVEHNFELIANATSFINTGFPILCAASRKSFLGITSGITDPTQRVHTSVAVAITQYLAGVRLFRVHDVAAHRQALAVVAAIVRAK